MHPPSLLLGTAWYFYHEKRPEQRVPTSFALGLRYIAYD